MPVLIMGLPDSGRRTWAEWLLRQHRARQALTIRADGGLSVDEARDLREWLSVRSREPRWASVDLDLTGEKAQNALLKLLEELPPGARVILRGQPKTVLGTIVSRARTVRLVPASEAEEVEWVEASAGCNRLEALQAVQAARGRPARALALTGQGEAASCGYGLVQAALSGDRVAVAGRLNDSQVDWAAVRDWLARWAARERPPRLATLGAARDVHDPRLAVRVALDRLGRT